MEEKRGASALPGILMLTLGPGGVDAAGGWFISRLLLRYWPPCGDDDEQTHAIRVNSSGGVELRGCGVESAARGQKFLAAIGTV
eukprot:scaffold47497_cov35-Cyclotella_meneghiniana.AAC.1